MDNELTKQLKDAGFPQGRTYVKTDGTSFDAYTPTFSELIEACGDGFDRLERWDETKIGAWFQAYMEEGVYDRIGGGCIVDCCGYSSGNTPEVALARLWLMLNKKHGNN